MNRSIIFGLVLILFGVIFFLDRLDLLTFGSVVRFGWPVVIICLGLWMIVRRQRETTQDQADTLAGQHRPTVTATATFTATSEPKVAPPPPPPESSHAGPSMQEASYATRLAAPPNMTESGKIKFNKFLGDMFVDCRDLDMQNVEVSSFIGDTDIVLRASRLAPGLNRLIISGFIGDVHILVPPDMPVFAHCSNFAGDLELFGRRSSSVGNSADVQTPNYAAAPAKLYIAANFFLGDIRIRNS